MGRYTGPRTKISRRFGEPIFGPDKVLERRPNPPGQHGANKRRKKVSEYGTQLKEKQKVKFVYGILEKQFHKYYLKAANQKGMTGENLLKLLELRLDNVIFRLSLASLLINDLRLYKTGKEHLLVADKLQPYNKKKFLLRTSDVQDFFPTLNSAFQNQEKAQMLYNLHHLQLEI